MLTRRRHGKDKEVSLAVAYSGDQVVGRGLVVNISHGGCGIQAGASRPGNAAPPCFEIPVGATASRE